MEKENKENPVLSFRAPLVVQKQLKELGKKWGENKTHVILRCISLAHEREKKSRG